MYSIKIICLKLESNPVGRKRNRIMFLGQTAFYLAVEREWIYGGRLIENFVRETKTTTDDDTRFIFEINNNNND